MWRAEAIAHRRDYLADLPALTFRKATDCQPSVQASVQRAISASMSPLKIVILPALR